MCEKLDGFKVYWNGTKFYSKHGKEIVAPTYFTNELPPVPLDGELWMGRGNLDRLVRAISPGVV